MTLFCLLHWITPFSQFLTKIDEMFVKTPLNYIYTITSVAVVSVSSLKSIFIK